MWCKWTSELWHVRCQDGIYLYAGEFFFVARVTYAHDWVAVSPPCEVMRSCCRCMCKFSYTYFMLWQGFFSFFSLKLTLVCLCSLCLWLTHYYGNWCRCCILTTFRTNWILWTVSRIEKQTRCMCIWMVSFGHSRVVDFDFLLISIYRFFLFVFLYIHILLHILGNICGWV